VPNGPEASRITIPLSDLKALFFVQDFDGYLEHRLTMDAWTEHRRQIAITFLDGDVLEGTTLSYSPKGPGFFVTPFGGAGNLRIFVASGALRHVRFPEKEANGTRLASHVRECRVIADGA
jgi:hypothetical protein